jgi:hypothetical protein
LINFNFQLDVLITPDFIWKDRFHGTAQRWWILVEVQTLILYLLIFRGMIAYVM